MVNSSPAPVLTPAQLVRAFGDVDIAALSEAELVDVIAAAEASKAAAAALQAKATMALLWAEAAARPQWLPARIARKWAVWWPWPVWIPRAKVRTI